MLSYVSCKTGDRPPDNAVQGGYDDGPSYHARGVVDGKMIPGKAGVRYDSDRRFVGACIPYGSRENRIHSFEVLTVDDPSGLSYVRCKTGDLPPDNAVQGGYDNGPSYHARGVVDGKMIPGKVGSPSASNMKGACIPYGSRERRIHDFEVLVKADTISSIEFHLDRGKLLETTPKVLTRQENSNNSSQAQSMEFSFSETVSNTSTFTHQWGLNVTVGTKFSCSIPCVANGKIAASASASVSLTWGDTKTIQKTYNLKFPLEAGPYTKVICKVVANEARLDVPYTLHFTSGKKSGGMWSGVSTWDVKTSYEQVKLN